MSRRVFARCLAGLTPLFAVSSLATEWRTDVAEARQIARDEGKDLLVYFTSSDGCAWCHVLERVILNTPEFVKVEDKFVLVKLDLPTDVSRVGEDAYERNREWEERWAVPGYPTLALIDVELRPFGMIVGHQPEGPAAVLNLLDAARAARLRRDELFHTGGTAEPALRAALLDEAITALPLEPEILAQSYRSEIETIIVETQDDGLRRRYRDLLNMEADRLFQEEIKKRIVERAGENVDSKAAVAVLDEALALSGQPESRRDWLLERKALYLWTEGSHARAVEALDAMLEGDDPLKSPLREIFRGQLVYLAGREEEGLERLDRLAGIYADLPDRRWSALDRKAQVLHQSGRLQAALAAGDVALAAATTPRDRYNTQRSRAEILTGLERHDEAAAAARDSLTAIREGGFPPTVAAYALLDLAKALAAGGDETAAAVAVHSARLTVARHDPAAAREDIAALVRKFPPVVPVTARHQ